MPDYESIWSAASELPLPQRLRLIDELAATVPDDHPPTLSAEWLAEIDRRTGEIDSGKVVPETWESVRQRLRTDVGINGANRNPS